jgi:hypothetical protein
VNFERTTSFSSLNVPESKNCQFQLFGKNQNQRIARSNYFKILKELSVLMKNQPTVLKPAL